MSPKDKFFLILILCCNLTATYSQNISRSLDNAMVKISGLVTSDIGDDELRFLDSLVINRKIVFLGESTHLDGTSYFLMNRIIKYLHEKHGYNVLLQEYGIYESKKAWDYLSSGKDSAMGVMNYLTQFMPYDIRDYDYELGKYLEDQLQKRDTLYLGGIDVAYLGIYGNLFVPELESWLLKFGVPKDSTDQIYKAFLTFTDPGHVGNIDIIYYGKPLADSVLQGKKKAEQIITQFIKQQLDSCDKNDIEGLEFMLKGIQAYIKEKEGFAYRELYKIGDGRTHSLRDSFMADNIDFFINHFSPDSKIIVSVSAYHTGRKYDAIKHRFNVIKNFTNTVGNQIHEKYGSKALHLCFISNKGKRGWDNDNFSGVEKNKTYPRTIERMASRKTRQFGFINFEKLEAQYGKQYRLKSNFGKPMKAYWNDIFDGAFFIKKMEPVRFFHMPDRGSALNRFVKQ